MPHDKRSGGVATEGEGKSLAVLYAHMHDPYSVGDRTWPESASRKVITIMIVEISSNIVHFKCKYFICGHDRLVHRSQPLGVAENSHCAIFFNPNSKDETSGRKRNLTSKLTVFVLANKLLPQLGPRVANQTKDTNKA